MCQLSFRLLTALLTFGPPGLLRKLLLERP